MGHLTELNELLPSTARQRWFSVGGSAQKDPVAAAVEATDAALTGTDPKLTIVFASSRFDLEPLVSTIAARTPGVPMIGCTTAGEISAGSAGEDTVAVTILGGDFDVVTRSATDAGHDLYAAGARVAEAVADLAPSGHQLLMLLTDGLVGDQREIVRGAYSEVGAAVPLVGGCAGDDAAMVETFQIIDGRVHSGSVVAAAIGSSSPIGVGVEHGWRPIGEPMLVTRSEGTSVFELDHAPALDVYCDRFGASALLDGTEEEFSTFAITHPLGLRRRVGEEVRFISGGEFDRRSLCSVAEIPQGSLVWMMEGDRESVLEGTEQSCRAALDALDGNDPIGLILFDCIARRNVLGPEGVESEMDLISAVGPVVPTAGFYTYGEIARTHGTRGFHNQTLVTLAIS